MPSLSSPLREACAQVMTGPAAPLERPRQTARREINRHVNVNGRCGGCAVVFSCERAVLPEMVLGSS